MKKSLITICVTVLLAIILSGTLIAAGVADVAALKPVIQQNSQRHVGEYSNTT